VPSWSDTTGFPPGRARTDDEGNMSVNEINSLLEMPESLLTVAETPPSGPDRNDVLQTVRWPK
jgi:hypothetical protein